MACMHALHVTYTRRVAAIFEAQAQTLAVEWYVECKPFYGIKITVWHICSDSNLPRAIK